MLVMFLTFLSYGGFFLRDIIMARQFGLGNELDGFYIGMMLPMFLVTVISIPFGQAIIPLFIEKVESKGMQAASVFASRISFIITAFLLMSCTLLYAASPHLISLTGWSFTPDKLAEARVIMLLFLPILLLSGVVITANSLLNALGNYHLPGMAQLVVPVIAVLTLLIFGNSHGIKIVAMAMAAGQIMNLAIVLWRLHSTGITIKFEIPADITFMRSLFKQYGPLILAAVLTSAAILVDNAIASSMPSGSVAALDWDRS
jgi:putative peptidoglycan lipid II flippase